MVMKKNIIGDINKKYGTPFYVFDEKAFTRNYEELQSAYRKIYNPFQIAYSFKTNYMPAICKTVLDLGGWAEVVSDMEYQMAQKYGFKPQNIIVNGPGKWYGIGEMASDGAIIMLDNEYEFYKVSEIAREKGISVKIGFRMNFDIGTNKQSRFGFDITASNTDAIIKKALNDSYLSVEGLHFHLGGSRGLEAWKNRASQMIQCVERYFADRNIRIIDLGSGMFGHLDTSLAQQFNQYIPTFEEYAETVASVFNSKYGDKCVNERPILVVEPGATIVANTMYYATKVIATKEIRGRKIAIVDGSVHQLGELGKNKQLPIEVITDRNNVREDDVFFDVTGYTCLEDDILFRSLKKDLIPGDIICFGNAGAYTNVMKPPFIQVGCKVLALTDKGIVLIKRQETIEDILSSYTML